MSPLRQYLAAFALLGLSACLFDGDESKESPLTTATLVETGLAGDYDMIDSRLEFTDGQEFTSTTVKGLMRIDLDSSYLQRIWINVEPTNTSGRLIGIRARANNRGMGEVTLTLEGSTKTGTSEFEFRGDTLTWITETGPSSDGKRLGFKETDRYLRTPPP